MHTNEPITIINKEHHTQSTFQRVEVAHCIVATGNVWTLIGYPHRWSSHPIHLATYDCRDIADIWETELSAGGRWFQRGHAFCR